MQQFIIISSVLAFESSNLKPMLVFSDRACPRDAANIHSHVGLQLLRHGLLSKNVRDSKAPSRLQ